MKYFELLTETPLKYHFTGKFESPSENWIHEDFPLTDYELFVITKGTLYISYHQQNYMVTEGEMLLLPPMPEPYNRRKGYRPSDCSFYWLHFSASHEVRFTAPQKVSLDAPHKLIIPIQQFLPCAEKVIVLMKQLQDAIRLNYAPFALDYMTTIILYEIHHQLLPLVSHEASETSTQRQIYHDIIDYIKQHIHTKLTVAEIADHFGYNEKYLSHMFSSISKMTLKQFILKNKMDAANFLLTDSNKSIQEIAISLGFSDSHHFMKSYKKITGLTPSEYRNAFSQRLLFHK